MKRKIPECLASVSLHLCLILLLFSPIPFLDFGLRTTRRRHSSSRQLSSSRCVRCSPSRSLLHHHLLSAPLSPPPPMPLSSLPILPSDWPPSMWSLWDSACATGRS